MDRGAWRAIVNEDAESDMSEHLAPSEYVWFASVEYFPLPEGMSPGAIWRCPLPTLMHCGLS